MTEQSNATETTPETQPENPFLKIVEEKVNELTGKVSDRQAEDSQVEVSPSGAENEEKSEEGENEAPPDDKEKVSAKLVEIRERKARLEKQQRRFEHERKEFYELTEQLNPVIDLYKAIKENPAQAIHKFLELTGQDIDAVMAAALEAPDTSDPAYKIQKEVEELKKSLAAKEEAEKERQMKDAMGRHVVEEWRGVRDNYEYVNIFLEDESMTESDLVDAILTAHQTRYNQDGVDLSVTDILNNMETSLRSEDEQWERRRSRRKVKTATVEQTVPEKANGSVRVSKPEPVKSVKETKTLSNSDSAKRSTAEVSTAKTPDEIKEEILRKHFPGRK